MKDFLIMIASNALLWIIYLALYVLAFMWLRRAWRIIVKKDFSEVALKRGQPPKDPQKYAPYTAAVNLIAGGVAGATAIGVFAVPLPFDTWTALGGSTLWMKIFADYIVSRQASMNDQRVEHLAAQKAKAAATAEK